MKNLSVFGLGYVGAVTAGCLAQMGHNVVGVDVNPAKVEMLKSGRAPVLEPQLDRLIQKNFEEGRLHATADAAAAIAASDISFVCVGTPSRPNGQLDLSSVRTTCDEIGAALRSKKTFHCVVLRSTMLPGTAKTVAIPALEAASGKRAGKDFAVCANPEFTREGSAVEDFMKPPMTVLGADDPLHLCQLGEVYQGISGQIFPTTLEAAEMVKYVCNAFHALKVAFANEVGTLCNHLEVDEASVIRIFKSDTRLNISSAYLTPGFAFGGSCLPKDLRALSYCATQLDLKLPLLQAVTVSNQAHLERAVDAVLASDRKKVAVLGLSFKPGTDDLRESPAVQLVKRLLGEGCHVRIWDPDVSLGRLVGSNRQFIEKQIPHIGALISSEMEEVVAQAEVVVVITKTTDTRKLMAIRTPEQIIIDLRSPVRPGHIHSAAHAETAFAASVSGTMAGRGLVDPAMP